MPTRKKAIERLRDTLINRREALRRALEGDTSMLDELNENATSGDVVDAALDSANTEISFQLAEVESREREQIEEALERMEEGTYGVCEVCSCNIPVARLNALPYADKCVKCQQAEEDQRNDPYGYIQQDFPNPHYSDAEADL